MPDIILNIRKFYVKPELFNLIYIVSWSNILYGENRVSFKLRAKQKVNSIDTSQNETFPSASL